MNPTVPPHSPAPEFRASLERELLRALHDEPAALPPSLRRGRRQRLRTALTLAAGLILGVGTQLASAQVQEVRQQQEIERVKQTERQAAMLRLMLARASAEEAERALAAGVGDRRAVEEAEVAKRAAEIRVQQLELELAEVRATSAMPRDELWAPKVGDRDFVQERLRLMAAMAQDELKVAELRASEVERRFAAGGVPARELQEAQSRLAVAREEFNRLALRLRLREQFLTERLSSEEVTKRVESFDVVTRAQRVQEMLRMAEARFTAARQRHGAGEATLLEVKRAELQVLELQAEMQQLQARLKSLPPLQF